MAEKSIRFPAPVADIMIRAMLDGRKTRHSWPLTRKLPVDLRASLSPKGLLLVTGFAAGDTLCVQEPTVFLNDMGWKTYYRADAPEWVRSTMKEKRMRWMPAAQMRRHDARPALFREVAGVRVMRVQDITEAEAMADGVEPSELVSAKESYRFMWDQLYLSRGFGWDSNPWIGVVEWKENPHA